MIHAIEVATARPYVVHVGAGALARAHEELANELERGAAALVKPSCTATSSTATAPSASGGERR